MNESYKAAEEAGWMGRAISRSAGIFAVAVLASAVILGTEVILRYGFDHPTSWAHETVVFLNATAFIFAGLFAAARKSHIQVVLIYDSLSARWRKRMDVAINLACTACCLFFVHASWQVLERALFAPGGEFRIERSGSAWNPPTPGLLKLFLFLILIAMAIQFAVLTFAAIRRPMEETS